MTRRESNRNNELEKQRRDICGQLATMGFVLPGSIVDRYTRCSRQRCSCHDDDGVLHGPYPTWTRKVNNKTVTRTLSNEQLDRYEPWFDAARRLRSLISELEAISIDAARSTEGQDDW